MPHQVPLEVEQEIDQRLTRYPDKRSALLPALHAIQGYFRYVPEELVGWVAAKLELESIQVMEVLTFYPSFRQTEPGRYHIRVCRTLSCAMAGSHGLMEALAEKAGIDRSHADHHHPICVSKDGRFSIEFAECLASCGTGPVCMVNDDLHEQVRPEDARKLLDRYS
jgi:NADH-quinone oxidoreductase subunit E